MTYDIFSSFNLTHKLTNMEDIFLSDDEENSPKPRLPLFSRCPVTNRAQLEHPQQTASPGKMKSALSLSPLKLSSPVKPQRGSPVKGRGYDILGHGPRVPLLAISNQCNRNVAEPSKIS